MPKILINTTIAIILIGAFYWAYTLIPAIQKEVFPEGLGFCLIDSDCVVFGETGDCNCGCYNKDYLPSKIEGECFCAAPSTCKCVEGECEGVFGEINSFEDCVDAGYTVM